MPSCSPAAAPRLTQGQGDRRGDAEPPGPISRGDRARAESHQRGHHQAADQHQDDPGVPALLQPRWRPEVAAHGGDDDRRQHEDAEHLEHERDRRNLIGHWVGEDRQQSFEQGEPERSDEEHEPPEDREMDHPERLLQQPALGKDLSSNRRQPVSDTVEPVL
jgi:hypothetical protein